MIAGKNGVTEKTTRNILFGAGTIHRGLKYTKGSGWNMLESLVGATSGGSKLSIVPTVTDVTVDGVNVAAKGLKKKTGEKATMEVNFVEMTPDIIKAGTLGAESAPTEEELAAAYTRIVSKADITPDDYWENIAFVGQTLEGEDVIAILPDSLCTSGFENEGKPNEAAIGKYTFECTADIGDETDTNTLPWEIYWPNRA
jgi:hypothetical protein